MKSNCHILAFSALTDDGLYNKNGFVPWGTEQSGPADVQRKQVYLKPHIGFGKLALPDKLAFSSAAYLFQTEEKTDHENTGIVLASTSGSLHTDLLYAKSVAEGFPRPAYFSATLPSSPLAEVAIMFRLKGPNRSIVSRSGALIKALESATMMLNRGKTDKILICAINGLLKSDTHDLGIEDYCRPYAFSLLLSSKKRETSVPFSFSSTNNYPNSSQNKTMKCTEEALIKELAKALVKNEPFDKNIAINYFTYNLSAKRS